MDEIEIVVYPPAGATYDDRRGHLLLKNQLSFAVGLKEIVQTDEVLNSAHKGEDAQNRKESDVKMLMVLVKNSVPSNLLLATMRKVVDIPKKITFPDFLIGGGLTWLEFTKNGSLPTGKVPNGCYVSALGTPEIIETYWTDSDYKEISGPIAFGSQVLLHIYTKDMYGQEVQIALTDRDVFDANDTVFKYRREVNIEKLHPAESGRKGLDGILVKDNKRVTHVQKITLPIVVDLSWQFKAGQNLKLFPIVKSEKTGAFFKGFTRKYLSVQLGGDPIFDLESRGNIAVMVGKVETNIRAFDPCKYTHIKLDYDNQPPAVLFDQKKQINAAIHTIDIGVIGNSFEEDEKKATITVKDVYTSECNNEPSLHEGVVIDITALKKAEIKNDYSEGTTTTLSFVPKFPYQFIDGKKTDFIPFFLEYFPAFNVKPALIALPVTTCAYQKQLDLRIYPDVAFSYHLFIGDPNATFDNKIYYRNETVDLIQGLDKELDWCRGMYDKTKNLQTYLPNGFLTNIAMTVIFDYLQNKANSFSFGMHAYHSYKGGKPTTIDYTAEYKYIAKIVIGAYIVLAILVDALLLYLTRGKNLPAMLKVARTAKRVGTYATGKIEGGDRDNIELIWPQISATRGVGYETQEDGRVALVVEEKVVAAPLFGLQYKIEETLGSFAARMTGITGAFDMAEKGVSLVGKLRRAKKAGEWLDKKVNDTPEKSSSSNNPVDYARPKDAQEALNYVEKKIHMKLDAFAEKYGQTANLMLKFDGFYDAHYHFKANILTKELSLDIFEPDGAVHNYIDNTQVVFGKNRGIDVEAAFEASSEIRIELSKIYHYVPNFLKNYVEQPEDIEMNSSADVKVIGSINFERKYTFGLNNEPYYEDNTIFTGLMGMVKVKIKVMRDDKEVWNKEIDISKKTTNAAGDSVDVLLQILPPFEIPGNRIPVFDKPVKEKIQDFFK